MTAEQVTRPRQRQACGLREGDVITCPPKITAEAAVTAVADHTPDWGDVTIGAEWDEGMHHCSRWFSVKRGDMVTVVREAGEPAPSGDGAAVIRAAQRAACAALRCLLWKAGVPLLAWTIDDVTGLLSAQAHTGEELQAWAGFLETEPKTSAGFTYIDATYMDVPVHIWRFGGAQ